MGEGKGGEEKKKKKKKKKKGLHRSCPDEEHCPKNVEFLLENEG